MLDVSVEPADAMPVVVLRGEHDAATAPDVDRVLASLLDDSDSLIVDLFAVTFLDASIVRVLLTGAGTTASRGGVLHLVVRAGSVADRVLDVLQIWSQPGVRVVRSRRVASPVSLDGRPPLEDLLERAGRSRHQARELRLLAESTSLRAAQLRNAAQALAERDTLACLEVRLRGDGETHELVSETWESVVAGG